MRSMFWCVALMGMMMFGRSAKAQDDTGSVNTGDLAGKMDDLRIELRGLREEVHSAEASADLALLQTAAAGSICPTDCRTQSELADAQRKLVSLGHQITWFKSRYTELADEFHKVTFIYGVALLDLNSRVDAFGTWATKVDGWTEEVDKWRADMDQWRQHKDETDDRQDGAITSLAGRQSDTEERVGYLETIRGAVHCRANVGIGDYMGPADSKLVAGLSMPISGGCGAELQVRDDKSRIWIFEGTLLGHFDPVINDAGAGGHIGIGWVLNSAKKQDWTLTIGGEAMRLSTKNVDGFSDASRWDIRPGFDVKHSWFIDRARIDIGLWGRVTAGVGTQVSDDIYNTHTNLTRFGGGAGAFLEVAIGPKWARWVQHH